MNRRIALILSAVAVVMAAVSFSPEPTAQAQQVSEAQKLAMRTKPSIVRIYDGYEGQIVWLKSGKVYNVAAGGFGSGSFINPNGYILTNAHVVESAKAGEEKGKEMLFEQYLVLLARDYNEDPRRWSRETIMGIAQNSQFRGITPVRVAILPDGSGFPFEIKSYGAPIGQGKDVAVIKIEVKNAPVVKLGDSDKVQLQDHVSVFGYPGAADTFQSGTLSRKSALEASITDGRVSAKKTAADNSPILQISAPATHGNSGGPVITDKGEVVGMLTFRGDTVGGQEVSGFAFVVPSSTVMEFVRQAGTTNEEGIVDSRYREGLDYYWDGYYSKAITKFEEVKRLFPQHSETDLLIRDSQQSISEGKEKSAIFSGALGFIVVGGGVLLVVGVGIVLLLVLRGRKPKQMAQPAPGLYGQQPMSQQSYPPQPQPQVMGSMPPQQSQGADMGKTRVLSAVGGAQPAPATFGSIVFSAGPLANQKFDIRAEGVYVGRDASLSQAVIVDDRVSKRHLWVGPRNGRIMLEDQGSTNGTFLNSLNSQRVKEAELKAGDVVIISEGDAARFVYLK
ncbi:MAG TPA: trypsin-like peptidase domain-containing protein [Blastocatellia bacterium]|nr:trypsin-like peptidase domain-containing protein [Blastocatellia bacterium]